MNDSFQKLHLTISRLTDPDGAAAAFPKSTDRFRILPESEKSFRREFLFR